MLYTYDIHPRYSETLEPVKCEGLNPAAKYRVKEVNLMPGNNPEDAVNGKVYSGDYLMKVGLDLFTSTKLHSRVLEIEIAE